MTRAEKLVALATGLAKRAGREAPKPVAASPSAAVATEKKPPKKPEGKR